MGKDDEIYVKRASRGRVIHGLAELAATSAVRRQGRARPEQLGWKTLQAVLEEAHQSRRHWRPYWRPCWRPCWRPTRVLMAVLVAVLDPAVAQAALGACWSKTLLGQVARWSL